jgi:CubicO group peptidase (beta-lactamase class C family)
MLPPDTYPIQRAMSALQLGQHAPIPSVPPPPDEWMRRLASLPLMSQPGEQWLYNTAADVLGVLVARAAGEPFDEFLRSRLFEPLGMHDTAFSVPPDKLGRLATSYKPSPDHGGFELYDAVAGSEWSRPPAFPSGGGGLVSTAADYLAFSRLMLSGGVHEGRRILSRPTVETMTIDHLTPAQKAVSSLIPGYFDSNGWGFGVAVVTRRDAISATVGSYGWAGGLGTTWSADPKEDMTTLLLTQRAFTSPSLHNVFLDVSTAAYQAIDD